MTVEELIEELKKHPSNMRVVVQGYEDGLDDVENILRIPILLDRHTEWYYGKHIQCLNESKKDETALVLLGPDISQR